MMRERFFTGDVMNKIPNSREGFEKLKKNWNI